MEIASETTKPANISIGGQPPKTMRQKLTSYKLAKDEDIKELTKIMAEGRDILLLAPTPECTYVMVRELIEVKVAL